MANKTIPQLPEQLSRTDDDLLAIVDSGETTTSKIKVSTLIGSKVDAIEGLSGELVFSGNNITIGTSGTDTITFDAAGADYWNGITTGTTKQLYTDFTSIDTGFTANSVLTTGTGDDTLVLGYGNNTITNHGSVFVGNNIDGTGVSIGSDLTNATQNSVNIGQNNTALKSDVCIGTNIKHSGNNPNIIVIGSNTQALNFRGIAIGTYSTNSASL